MFVKAFFFVVLCALVVIGVAALAFARKRCPRCKTRDGLVETGATKRAGWYSLTRFEYRCQRCGQSVWRLSSDVASENT